MGIRGELYSAKFQSEGRTYFFNVKQNRMGDVFLSIVESKPTEGEMFDRHAIVVFGDQMPGFLDSLRDALKHMDRIGNKVDPFDLSEAADQDRKPARKARAPRDASRDSFREPRPYRADRNDRPERGERPASASRSGFKPRSAGFEKPDRAERSDRPDRADRPARAPAPRKTFRSDRSDRPDRAERPDRAPKSEAPRGKRIVVRKKKDSGEFKS